MIFFLNKSFRQLMCQECLWVLSNILIVQNQRLTIILYFAWGKTDSELKNKWIFKSKVSNVKNLDWDFNISYLIDLSDHDLRSMRLVKIFQIILLKMRCEKMKLK